MGQCFQVLPDFGPGACGADKAEPGRVGRGGGVGLYFNHVAILELGAQGNLFAINAGTQCAVTDVAVDRVSKVDHRGAAR